ncbi:hypothetical protein JTE90_005476 [Oedothorax gibbosus]|uniref:Uncharacterized protein n=1 Tax=Oedothorax gibbosus TaxID=931172 RepID=A0AAV6UNR3_9ARAC|nr:hypothetical protein JTE90_005476 [Oedothorax gibbosus]
MRREKTFRIAIGRREVEVSLDRLKPAHYCAAEEPPPITSSNSSTGASPTAHDPTTPSDNGPDLRTPAAPSNIGQETPQRQDQARFRARQFPAGPVHARRPKPEDKLTGINPNLELPSGQRQNIPLHLQSSSRGDFGEKFIIYPPPILRSNIYLAVEFAALL